MNVLVNNSYSGDKVTEKGKTRCLQLHDNTGENSGTQPDIIAVYLGVNDCCNGVSADTFETAYKTMLNNMVSTYSGAKIFVFNLVPNGKGTADATMRQFNSIIANAVAEHADNCVLVDMYSNAGFTYENCKQVADTTEGLHPNEAGMDMLTNCFINALIDYYINAD